MIFNSLMCDLRSHYRITVDKRLRYTSPKLPLATSFIRTPLGEVVGMGLLMFLIATKKGELLDERTVHLPVKVKGGSINEWEVHGAEGKVYRGRFSQEAFLHRNYEQPGQGHKGRTDSQR